MKIIIDSNILFSALIKENNIFRNLIIFQNQFDFFTPYLSIIEIFKYKERIFKFSKMTESEIYESYYSLIKQINIFNEADINPECIIKAYDLCWDIDIKDIPFVALALELDGFLFTGDKKLKDGLQMKGFKKFFEI